MKNLKLKKKRRGRRNKKMIAIYELTRGKGTIPTNLGDAQDAVRLMRSSREYITPSPAIRGMLQGSYSGKPIETITDLEGWCVINVIGDTRPIRMELSGVEKDVLKTKGELVRLLVESGLGLR